MDIKKYLDEVVYVAKSNLGYGETTANNEGKFLEAIGVPQGSEWCAGFARYCYRKAASRLSYRVPFDTNTLGARRLVKNLGFVGRFYREPHAAVPGDLVAWNRGVLGWQGHVGIVIDVDNDGIITTIEGNVGRYPAKVKTLVHDVTKERLYGFASLLK